MKPEEVKPDLYTAVYFVGGHGAMCDLPDNVTLMNITRIIYERNGIVSGVCHGPAGFVNVKLSNGEYLVKNKQLTSFTDKEEREGREDKVVPFLREQN